MQCSFAVRRSVQVGAYLDPAHAATALRCIELNPARARMAARVEDWAWARAHLYLLATPAWHNRREFAINPLSAEHWRESLGALTRGQAAALRLARRHDTAFGSPEFVEQLERK